MRGEQQGRGGLPGSLVAEGEQCFAVVRPYNGGGVQDGPSVPQELAADRLAARRAAARASGCASVPARTRRPESGVLRYAILSPGDVAMMSSPSRATSRACFAYSTASVGRPSWTRRVISSWAARLTSASTTESAHTSVTSVEVAFHQGPK
ncbi:hypothetical protein [Streptomyces sp. NPDC059398]|uniref:hypothetical protein n=1 Tax=Streptomyces sp. NPDC059398 TaxID=3346820 RepID=UPI00367D62F5